MAERIKQVAITYTTHRYILVGGIVAFVVVVVPNLIAASHAQPPTGAVIPLVAAIGMPLMFLLPFLVGHIKSQFSHSRARLLPNFAAPHLTILAAVLVLSLWIYPLFVAWYAHIDPVALVAITTAIAVPVIWGLQLQRTSLFFVGLIVFLSLYTERAQQWWFVDTAAHRPIQATIAALGAALLAAWLRRLSQLNEEMDDYGTTMQWRVARPGGGEAIEQRRLAANQVRRSPLITWINDAWFARLPAGPTTRSTFQLAQLLRYGFGSWPVAISALFMTACMTATALFMFEFALVGHDSDVGMLNFMLFFAIIMPGFQAGEALAQRRRRVSSELLLPMSRPQLIDGLFTASAHNMIVYWLIMNAGFLLVAWHILGDRLTLEAAAMYVLLSLATAFVTLGLSTRIAVWRSQFLRLAFVMVMWLLMAPLAGWWLARDRYGDFPFVVLAVILAGIGTFLVANARQAWLNLELG
jgi:hypothetical protein